MHSLHQPSRTSSSHLTDITFEKSGISQAMISEQPSTSEIIRKLRLYIGDRPIIAHNASFDMKFYVAETKRVFPNIIIQNPSICTLLLSRRLFDAESYKLTNLQKIIGYKKLADHKNHRYYIFDIGCFHVYSLYRNIVSTRTPRAPIISKQRSLVYHPLLLSCFIVEHQPLSRALDDVLVTIQLWRHIRNIIQNVDIWKDRLEEVELYQKVVGMSKEAVYQILHPGDAITEQQNIPQPTIKKRRAHRSEEKRKRISAPPKGFIYEK